MPLFTDGPISTIDDLRAHDSQLIDVAVVEGIDLTNKLNLAQEELGLELTALLARLQFADWRRFAATLNNIVVTPAVRLWHTYHALAMAYRDAYSNELNDRYGAKRDQFGRLAKWASEQVARSGIGITMRPVPRASTPTVKSIPGGLADGVYYVTTAWINDAGEEGGSAIPAVVSLAGSTMQVDAGSPPQNATAWNVYVGDGPDTMVMQNGSPLAAQLNWYQPPILTQRGKAPGMGQEPNYLQEAPRVIQRG